MARPRLDPTVPRPGPRPVRLDQDIDDALCRLAHKHGVSVHALLKLAAKMVIELDGKYPQAIARRLP